MDLYVLIVNFQFNGLAADHVSLLEGQEGQKSQDCLALGRFDLKGLPARPDLIGRIEVTFALDASGLLTAKARDMVSGKTVELEVDYKNGSSNAPHDVEALV